MLSGALEHGERKKEQIQSPDKNSSRLKVKGNFTSSNDRRPKAVTPGKKVKSGSKRVFMGPRSDISCTRLGGICQPVRYICQDRYLKDKCSGAKTRQCCMPGMIEICICPYRNVTITQTSCKLLQMVTNTQLILFFCQEGIKMDLQSFFQVWLMKTLLWEWGCMCG